MMEKNGKPGECPVCGAPSERALGLSLYCDDCAEERPEEFDERDDYMGGEVL
jgi:hypothetical protein